MSPDDVKRRYRELVDQGKPPRDAFQTAHKEATDAQNARHRAFIDGTDNGNDGRGGQR